MELLLSNDDGVLAPGIRCLAAALAASGRQVTVVAPDRERSSIGHALTLNRPLYIHPLGAGIYPEGVRAFSCDGTPTDCVCLGIEAVAPEARLVLSGINRGPNLADDVTYSGTVMAAMEGVILGRPALALSLDCSAKSPAPHYETAAAVALALLERIERTPLPEGLLLNVNVPDRPIRTLEGIRATRRGTRSYREKITTLSDPHGRTCYWIGGRPEDLMEEGTDVWAVASGYASVSPVQLDLTDYRCLEDLSRDGLSRIGPEDLERTLAEIRSGLPLRGLTKEPDSL
jgi:5'-nucleotidase